MNGTTLQGIFRKTSDLLEILGLSVFTVMVQNRSANAEIKSGWLGEPCVSSWAPIVTPSLAHQHLQMPMGHDVGTATKAAVIKTHEHLVACGEQSNSNNLLIASLLLAAMSSSNPLRFGTLRLPYFSEDKKVWIEGMLPYLTVFKEHDDLLVLNGPLSHNYEKGDFIRIDMLSEHAQDIKEIATTAGCNFNLLPSPSRNSPYGVIYTTISQDLKVRITFSIG